MKYSFMTFSCPDSSLENAVKLAKRLGYDAIEPRTARKHKHGIEIESDSSARREIRELIAKSGIELSCLASSCRFADPCERKENIENAIEAVQLAADIGCRNVRVFGGKIPDNVSREEAIESVASALKEIAVAAEDNEVYVCMEVHDDWCDPEHVAAVIELADHPLIAVNWDIMHSVRTAGKSIEQAFTRLRLWIRHCHFHDGVWEDDANKTLTIVPVGEGGIDHQKAVELLQESGYDGFLSGEWIRRPDLPPEEYLRNDLATMKNYEAIMRQTITV